MTGAGCPTCSSPLDPTGTCLECLAAGRDLLAAVLTMWAELPAHVGQLRSVRYARGTASDTTVPGGDVLVLAGPGGMGSGRRCLTATERAQPIRWWLQGRVGPLPRRDWQQLEAARTGREHQVDNQPRDTPSVAQLLAQWEDDWRHTRGEPAAVLQPAPGRWWLAGRVGPLPLAELLDQSARRRSSTARVVDGAGRYLERHTGWAVREHPAFGEYLADLQALHGRLELATGRVRNVVRAHVDCLACGSALVKVIDDAGLEAEDFTCQGCERVWTDQHYRLALRAEVARRNTVEVDGWTFATPQLVAAALGRSEATLRSWERQQLVRRLLDRGRLLLCVEDATAVHEARPTRERRAS